MRSNVKLSELEDYLKTKRACFSVKVTTTLDSQRVQTSIHGELKNKFFDDCIKRNVTEAEMARNIIEAYYSIVGQQKYLVEKEMTEIKKYIIEKIKL
jgi:hypothetical protein